MSNWVFLNKHRVTKPTPNIPDRYVSDDSFGFNGMFRFFLDGELVRCIASDGYDWQHVSISIEHSLKTPKWAMMCQIKDLFWEPEDVVVQYHPKHSEYVNMHPGCLHLWRPTIHKMPTPPSILVGYRNVPSAI